MGNNNSTEISEGKIALLKEKRLKGLGQLKEFQIKNSNRFFYCIKSRFTPESPENRCAIKHPNFLNAVTYESQFQEIFGISNWGLNYFFEKQELTLDSLIQDRIQENGQNSYFQESEILSFWKQILQLINFLHQNNIILGDIEPCTIFFDEKQQLYKIYDMQLILGKYGAYSLLENEGFSKRFPFISPEMCQAHQNTQQPYKKIDQFQQKSDIFQLALTLIEMMTLQPSVEIFDKGMMKILWQVLDGRIQQISQQYGQFYANILKEMVREDPLLRIDGLILYRKLFQTKLQQIMPQQSIYGSKVLVQGKGCGISLQNPVNYLKQRSISTYIQSENQNQHSEVKAFQFSNSAVKLSENNSWNQNSQLQSLPLQQRQVYQNISNCQINQQPQRSISLAGQNIQLQQSIINPQVSLIQQQQQNTNHIYNSRQQQYKQQPNQNQQQNSKIYQQVDETQQQQGNLQMKEFDKKEIVQARSRINLLDKFEQIPVQIQQEQSRIVFVDENNNQNQINHLKNLENFNTNSRKRSYIPLHPSTHQTIQQNNLQEKMITFNDEDNEQENNNGFSQNQNFDVQNQVQYEKVPFYNQNNNSSRMKGTFGNPNNNYQQKQQQQNIQSQQQFQQNQQQIQINQQVYQQNQYKPPLQQYQKVPLIKSQQNNFHQMRIPFTEINNQQTQLQTFQNQRQIQQQQNSNQYYNLGQGQQNHLQGYQQQDQKQAIYIQQKNKENKENFNYLKDSPNKINVINYQIENRIIQSPIEFLTQNNKIQNSEYEQSFQPNNSFLSSGKAFKFQGIISSGKKSFELPCDTMQTLEDENQDLSFIEMKINAMDIKVQEALKYPKMI